MNLLDFDDDDELVGVVEVVTQVPPHFSERQADPVFLVAFTAPLVRVPLLHAVHVIWNWVESEAEVTPDIILQDPQVIVMPLIWERQFPV